MMGSRRVFHTFSDQLRLRHSARRAAQRACNEAGSCAHIDALTSRRAQRGLKSGCCCAHPVRGTPLPAAPAHCT